MTDAKKGKPKAVEKTDQQRLNEFRAANPHIDFDSPPPAGGWEHPLFVGRHAQLMDEWVKDPELSELSLPVIMYALKSATSANNSSAAKKLRPPKKPTCRTETIQVMRRSRASGQRFKDFLESASTGSIDGVEIALIDADPEYEISVDSIEGGEGIEWVKLTTLEKWWSEAGKQNR